MKIIEGGTGFFQSSVGIRVPVPQQQQDVTAQFSDRANAFFQDAMVNMEAYNNDIAEDYRAMSELEGEGYNINPKSIHICPTYESLAEPSELMAAFISEHPKVKSNDSLYEYYRSDFVESDMDGIYHLVMDGFVRQAPEGADEELYTYSTDNFKSRSMKKPSSEEVMRIRDVYTELDTFDLEQYLELDSFADPSREDFDY